MTATQIVCSMPARTVRLSLILFLFIVATFTGTPALAQETTDCETALTQAESSYFNGNFDRTISLIEPCLASESYTTSQGVRAYSLLGRTHYVLGELEEATEAIQGLYLVDATYSPDPQLPPDFAEFMDGVKEDMIADGTFPQPETPEETPEEVEPAPVITDNTDDQPDEAAKPARKRRALWLGGGAALAVAAGAAILLGGGSNGGTDTPSEWPLPPAHPN